MLDTQETGTELMRPGFHYQRNKENADPLAQEERVYPIFAPPPAKETLRESISEFFNSLVEIWVESGKAWDARQTERREAKQASRP
jgi:hypothetical protein